MLRSTKSPSRTSSKPIKRQQRTHTKKPIPHKSPKRQLSTQSPPQSTTTSTTTTTTTPPPQDNTKRLKIKHLTTQLQSIDSPQPQREAWWIISKASKIPEAVLRKAAKYENLDVAEPDIDVTHLLNSAQLEAVYSALDDRIRLRKPLQYVLGDVDFCQLSLSTKEGILIPRPETEQMVTWLCHQIKLYNQYVLYEKQQDLNQLPQTEHDSKQSEILHQNHEIENLISKKQLFDFTEDNITLFHGKYPLHRFRFSWYDAVENPLAVSQRSLKIAKERVQTSNFTPMQALQAGLDRVTVFDFCSGSGNIALTLASQFPESKVVGVDIDPNALQLARYNKQQLNIKNCKFYHCDLFRNSISQTRPPPTELTDYIYPEHLTQFSNDYNSHQKKEQEYIESPQLHQKPIPKPKTAVAQDSDHQILESHLGLFDLPMLSSLADIIISNPPYVHPDSISTLDPEVKNWENHYALTPLPVFYNYPDQGVPYKVPDIVKQSRNIKELPPWPTKEQIKQHCLPFYERIIKAAPRLLTHNEHLITRQNIRYPRLVLEVGSEDELQILHVANMASYIFDVEIYLDAYDRPRWVVGFEPYGDGSWSKY